MWHSSLIFEDHECQTRGKVLSDECIHGLELGRCDLCFPQPAPVADANTKVATATRKSTRAPRAPRAMSLRSTPAGSPSHATASRRATAKPSGVIVDDGISEQRIYHFTHIDNLAAILSSGALLADASEALSTRPTVDVSTPRTRESRRATKIAGEGDLTVANYVPFFLSPNSTVWERIRSNTADARLVAGTEDSAASDFVILVSTVKLALDSIGEEDESVLPSIAVTDGDATHVLSRFGTTREGADRLLRGLRADKDAVMILDAEYLVRETFPLENVTLLGVANDKARAVVKKILKESDFSPKVAVYPPWFQPTAELVE
jgi:hypothetical protein